MYSACDTCDACDACDIYDVCDVYNVYDARGGNYMGRGRSLVVWVKVGNAN